jgi:hypothetical protein
MLRRPRPTPCGVPIITPSRRLDRYDLGLLARYLAHIVSRPGDEDQHLRRADKRVECRAARGLLDWTQSRLAGASGLAVSTVVRFERSGRVLLPGTVQAMQLALEAAGVEFIAENGGGPGVRLKKRVMGVYDDVGRRPASPPHSLTTNAGYIVVSSTIRSS